jgi:hypothetical protein
LTARGAHGRVQRVARAESFTTSLARPVSGIERIRTLRVGLDGAISVVDQSIAYGETSDLVEANRLS